MAKMKLAHALRRGETLEVTIDSLANGGDGVAKCDGVPIFVDRAAVGDKVLVRLFDVRKDFARGAIEKIIQPSPERSEPPCQHFDQCGGCQWQHLSYEAQLANKESLVRQALKHIAGMGESLSVEPIAGAPGDESL
ncbi:MAG: TRAM domain-containing protein, partial [Cyanobacteria bacterium REEB67]|nr:TRAM domain-containing protein [Cyanobacteria bacterium REEB67]